MNIIQIDTPMYRDGFIPRILTRGMPTQSPLFELSNGNNYGIAGFMLIHNSETRSGR